MTTAMPFDCTLSEMGVSLQPSGERCVVTVNGKEESVELRRRLVRRGTACTFPMPTWKGSTYTFYARYPEGMSYDDFEEVVHEVSSIDCGGMLELCSGVQRS